MAKLNHNEEKKVRSKNGQTQRKKDKKDWKYTQNYMTGKMPWIDGEYIIYLLCFQATDCIHTRLNDRCRRIKKIPRSSVVLK